MQEEISPRSWDLETRPGHLINRVTRLMARDGEVALQALGVGMAAFPVLHLLREGRRMTQRDLALAIKLEQPTMAKLLARMERDGLIDRQPDPNDRRSSLVGLTDHAEALRPRIGTVVDEVNERAVQGLSDDDLDTLTRLLSRMIGNLE